MFGIEGSPALASSLQSSLIDAASKDDFSQNAVSHGDGWGGVWYSETDQNYVRSTTPIFKDPHAPLFFKTSAKLIIGLSHARKAAPNEPMRGPFDSHPFSTYFDEELVYVTHNGQIDKKKFSDLFSTDVSKLNDTEVFTYLLQKQNGTAEQRIRAAIDQVYKRDAALGALNLMILTINRERGRKIYYYCSNYPDPQRELYYSLYLLRQKEGGSAIMSSTVAYKAGLVDSKGNVVKVEVKKCPKGELGTLNNE